MKVKCKVIKLFTDSQNEDKLRRIGEEFECTLERAEFLQKNDAVEIIEVAEKPAEEPTEVIAEEKPKRKRTKKTIENDK